MAEPTNTEIAAALEELGDLYELDGAIVHRVVAYRNAAKAVREASTSVAGLARAGRATELPGIGATLQEKIQALVDTGQIPAAEKLRAKFPPGLVAITRLAGLGPKRARMLYDELGIDSLDALRTFERVHASGTAGARATTHSGLRVDLRIVAPEQFGNLLQHFTGSKQHNMALRDMAVRRGLHVSEYGVLDDATGETRTCAT